MTNLANNTNDKENPFIWNNHDLVVEINTPGAGTLSYLGKELRDAGVAYDRFTMMTPHIDLINNDLLKENIARIKDNNQVLILDFEFAANKETVESMKKTVQLAKDAGLQVVVIVPNYTHNINSHSATINRFKDSRTLFEKLDDLVQSPDYSLKDSVVNAMNSMKEKLGLGTRKSDQKFGGLPNKKM